VGEKINESNSKKEKMQQNLIDKDLTNNLLKTKVVLKRCVPTPMFT